MQRLDFVLPDFVRMMWVSDEARAVWAPRLQRITRAWLDIEWLAVVAGVRSCGLTSVSPEEYVAKGHAWARHGLSAVPVALQGATNYAYSSTSQAAEPGKPISFRVVVGRPDDVAAFQAAYDALDDPAMGRLLGYPDCCRAFFQETWVNRAMVDTTWPMATADQGLTDGQSADCIEVSGPPEANILWRWMGVRAASHLPCSFRCQETVKLASTLVQVGRDAGYDDEMDWLLDILSWPVEWSALHGIAEIKTPVLKVSARTDATAARLTVRYMGTGYPEQGATGVVFPFRAPEHRRITRSRGFRRGLENPIHAEPAFPDWYATDNGFSSRFIMESAHAPIVELAGSTLGKAGGTVLDLGCGNAALLRELHERNPAIQPFGLEIDGDRLDHAGLLLPDFRGNFWQGDLFDAELPWQDGRIYDLVLLMPGRLLEVEAARAERLRETLRSRSRHLLVYAYGDWLTRYSGLGGLAQAAGLRLIADRAHGTVAASLAVVADGIHGTQTTHAGGEHRV